MRSASATAGAPGSTPQRRPPTSISTSTSSDARPPAAAGSSSATCVDVVDAHADPARCRASAARRSSLRGARPPRWTTSTSGDAAPTSTSASDTFWQHTARPRRSAICSGAIIRRLVRLGVRAQRARRPCADSVGHAVEVALEGVEIDHQRRRVDLGQRHARRLAGGGMRHEASPEGCATIASSGTRGNERIYMSPFAKFVTFSASALRARRTMTDTSKALRL